MNAAGERRATWPRSTRRRPGAAAHGAEARIGKGLGEFAEDEELFAFEGVGDGREERLAEGVQQTFGEFS